jgi:hypothetical protein
LVVALPDGSSSSKTTCSPRCQRYWPLLVVTLSLYVVLTQTVKTWLLRKAGIQPAGA